MVEAEDANGKPGKAAAAECTFAQFEDGRRRLTPDSGFGYLSGLWLRNI